MKTAAFILNHNLPDYTDMLYESLKPYERYDYDLFVIDNGSSNEGKSKHTSFELGENVYFGGGFNAAMQYTLDNKEYDSMLFLNNDLTVHPYNFVRSLREEMFEEVFAGKWGSQETKYDIVSPSFYNIEAKQQCFWKTMHSYCEKSIRAVPFIDFQCPLISRRLLEEIKEIHQSLIIGWGIDFMFALTAKDKGWKLGVVDRCCVLHHNSLTVKRGVAGINIQQYCQRAEAGQYEYFFNVIKRQEDYTKLRKIAENYEYNN
jgi:hypothetical protein